MEKRYKNHISRSLVPGIKSNFKIPNKIKIKKRDKSLINT
jgi:hypothetical protein